MAAMKLEALLREAREAAQKARDANSIGLPLELLLLDCYAALRPLDALTGATTADDILNRIFSTFCVGKKNRHAHIGDVRGCASARCGSMTGCFHPGVE